METLKDLKTFLNAQNAAKALQMGQIAGMFGEMPSSDGSSTAEFLGKDGFLSPIQKQIEDMTGITLPMILTALSVYNSGKVGDLASGGIDLFRKFGTSSVRINVGHDLAKAVEKWLIGNCAGKKTQHLAVENNYSTSKDDSLPLEVSRKPGLEWFRYDGHFFLYQYLSGAEANNKGLSSGGDNFLMLVCLGRSP
ncbi:hypothetical protein BU16DRAFT_537652 [Lophium mytilinum]|uniref:Uncharacterized protein n=1 Tax=Lophium mytilinum TaxID=390894 RepID=A0A6A6R136_9PEZI|nr:hypothetical protein BU16DRAFT_537652 [Lophium mytilinum]